MGWEDRGPGWDWERTPLWCEHHECRCARSRELAAIYDRTGQGRYLREAIDVHEQRVVCRRTERPS
jgi:hypothetical protein